ncbi:hypothetical protein CBI33_22555 [Rhodococcus erythropolis]|nr:hypothetical protein CBI33_22555 [Rhodococcus erythropolis]
MRPTSSISPVSLRDARLRKGESLRDAASSVAVTAGYLSRVERGQRVASAEVAQRLCSHYALDQGIISEGTVVPADVISILAAHPVEIARLREKYQSGRTAS